MSDRRIAHLFYALALGCLAVVLSTWLDLVMFDTAYEARIFGRMALMFLVAAGFLNWRARREGSR